METTKHNPSWRLGSLFLIGLSLSIGWGIRGNFGHEYGAAFAGCLAAIAVALLSGREDWRQRIPWFALFGALGWGFGASQSYMQVLSYSESGHAISQWFGYASIFYIGFLWAALGGAGTAFAAVATREQIVMIFKPLLFIFGAWLLLGIIEDPVAQWLQRGANFDDTWSRHKNPLYWFDSDYLAAFFALLGAGAYDLYERRRIRNRIFLPVFAAGGAISGFIIQLILRTAGLEHKVATALTYLLGDPAYINPETGRQAYEASNLLNNWPQWFSDYPQHIGWIIGLILGITAYFIFFGKFRNGSSLFVYMGGGWLLAFLVLPVLGSLFFAQNGGIRMTPPRSDDWAGITGVLIGTSIWLWRNNLRPVAVASVISGTIGGLGFAGMQWLKQLMMSLGNPAIIESKGILPGSDEFNSITSAWANWQGQNWHSFMEQSYGFVNGIAIAAALGFLASRMKIHTDSVDQSMQTKGRWTRTFSVLFILLALTYFNVFKNVDVWSGQLNQSIWKTAITNSDGTAGSAPAQWDLPYLGRLPGIDFLHMTPSGWFNLTWALLVIACIIIVVRHYRSPLAIIPKSPLAKGQLIFLILLWIMVVANFERALTGWHPNRMLTEWVIFVNAIIATVLVLLLPRETDTINIVEKENYKPLYKRLWIIAIATFIISSILFLVTNRMIYHYPEYNKLDHKQYHTRFGPDASWRTKPNLKNAEKTVKSVMDNVIENLYKTMNAKELSELDNQKVMSLFRTDELQVLSSKHWIFDVNVPVVVSIMRSKEQKQLPFWLAKRDFIKTDMVVKNEQTTYEVWQKSFNAGRVGLGINGFENYSLHYFVSVTPWDFNVTAATDVTVTNWFGETFPVKILPTTNTSLDTSLYVGMPANIALFDAQGYNKGDGPAFAQPERSPYISYLHARFRANKETYIKMDLMMYSEVEFLLAEAAQRGGFSASDPEGHYKNGIMASLKRWGITDGTNGFSFDTYYSNPKVSYSSAGDKLERIIEQKWISLWLTVESWFSWRATGYPVLIVGPVTQYGAALPLRFMYPVPSQDPKYLVNYSEAVAKLETTSYVPAGQSKDHTYSRMWLLQGTGKPY